jgi:hypothetical protein
MIPVGDPYVLAVIPDADVAPSCPSDHFKIVAASSWKYGVFSQVKTCYRILFPECALSNTSSAIGANYVVTFCN